MRPAESATRTPIAVLFAAASLASTGPALAGGGYTYAVVGNPADVAATPTPGLALMGGGADVDAAFQWMTASASGRVSACSRHTSQRSLSVAMGAPAFLPISPVSSASRIRPPAHHGIFLHTAAIFFENIRLNFP